MAKRSFVQMVTDSFAQQAPKASGLTKHGSGDPLRNQRVVRARQLSPAECRALYESNWLGGNVVDTLVEDMTREGFEVEILGEEQLAQDVASEIANLKVLAALSEMAKNGFIDGDSYIALGYKVDSLASKLADPAIETAEFAYLSPFTRAAATDQKRVANPFKDNYGDFERYKINIGTRLKFGLTAETWVDASRILHFQPYPQYGTVWGNSFYQRIVEPIQIIDNATWSIGQIVYQLVLKVLKIDMDDFHDRAEKLGLSDRELMGQVAGDLNTLTMYMVDKGSPGGVEQGGENADELSMPSPAGALGGVSAISEFIWQLLAGATRMPRTVLIGNEAGKLTGAEWDSRTYYARVRGMQEKYFTPLLRRVVDQILRAGGQDPEAIDYKIEYAPLFTLDETAQADVQDKQSQTDERYIMNQVRTVDEVRLERFGQPSLGSSLFEKTGEEEVKEETVEAAAE